MKMIALAADLTVDVINCWLTLKAATG